MSKKGGHHGGAWKVAYADFITAMMALFLVLWLSAQDTKIKEAVERAFRNPFSAVTKESTGIIPNANKDASATFQQQGNFQSVSAVEMETMRHVSEDLSKLLKQDEDASSIKIEMTPDGLRINVFDRSDKPIFETDKSTFTTYGAWVFSTLAWEISRYRTFRIELDGHTELNTQAGAETHDKWELSTGRANAARIKLVENGVVSEQICKVSGFADTVPMPDLPPEAEANRRVTVLLKLKESVNALTPSAPETENDSPKN
ncbi:MAG TPA: flagellar motor protein MotB [Verrucomicrobiae bacterium]|jgi:chemotaxis protein MotB|nr:flagellar motor protein MotB [Verrucomicrobiae bacterium]